MKQRFRDLSLQLKMIIVSLITNMLVFAVNVALLFGINSMSNRIDSVYRENLNLNLITESLNAVQASMTEYLNTKTSDALEDYYRKEQSYKELIQTLDDRVMDSAFVRMERNIKEMSGRYLDEVSQTIEAKRGRNVEKYRDHYEKATDLHSYIKTYIYSLNNEQLAENSSNYSTMLVAFKRFETISFLVMVFVICANLLLITRITAALITPLRELSGAAEEVSKGNFDIEPLAVYSGDEVGVVTNTFNQMVINIQNYISQIKHSMEVEQEMKEKELMMRAHLKDAQLRLLQAQINPHFLFNTLNAGAQLAMMESADRTYEYVQNVAEFFRYNVKKGSVTVTVRDEINLIDNYIYILNVRFSGDIHYEKQIDEELLNIRMPSMILQPIVENCVNHGIREMMGEGKIELKVFADEEGACISISDNGAGMTQETIDSIMAGTIRDEVSSDSNGIGMDNVIARLRLFEGNDDCVKIYSEGPGKGSSFLIHLRCKEEEKESAGV